MRGVGSKRATHLGSKGWWECRAVKMMRLTNVFMLAKVEGVARVARVMKLEGVIRKALNKRLPG